MNARIFIPALLTILVSGFSRAETWETDYQKALAQARQENKFVFLDFTGSDWCGWCIRLDKEVFSQSDFRRYAKDNLVCVTLDYPRGKPQSKSLRDQNAELNTKFGIKGYPTIVLLDPQGKEVARTGYQAGGAETYVAHLETLLKPHRENQPAPTATAPVPAAERIWTDSSGRTLKGSLVAQTDTAVTIQTPEGKPVTVDLSTLSAGDRQYLSNLSP